MKLTCTTIWLKNKKQKQKPKTPKICSAFEANKPTLLETKRHTSRRAK